MKFKFHSVVLQATRSSALSLLYDSYSDERPPTPEAEASAEEHGETDGAVKMQPEEAESSEPAQELHQQAMDLSDDVFSGVAEASMEEEKPEAAAETEQTEQQQEQKETVADGAADDSAIEDGAEKAESDSDREQTRASFDDLHAACNRSAAAKGFANVLVLASEGALTVSQASGFGDIRMELGSAGHVLSDRLNPLSALYHSRLLTACLCHMFPFEHSVHFCFQPRFAIDSDDRGAGQYEPDTVDLTVDADTEL